MSDSVAHPFDRLKETVEGMGGVLQTFADLLEPNPDLTENTGALCVLMRTAAVRLERANADAERYFLWMLYFGPERSGKGKDFPPIRKGPRPKGRMPAGFRKRKGGQDE